MRVLAVVAPLRTKGNIVGGAERRFTMIDHEIRRYGVQFICLKLETATASNLKGSHWFGRNGYTDTIKSLIQALRIVRLWNCAGIYVYHADRANCMTIGLLVNKLLRKPLFVVVHDDAGKGRDTVSLRRLFSSELSIGRQPKLAIAKTLAAWMKRIGVRWAEACFCPSFSTARYVRDDLHARRVVVSRNGVEMPQGYPRSPKRFDGIFVGRVDPLKGIDVLVSAWKIVTSKKPNARLVIVGAPGRESDLVTLRNSLTAYGLTDNVQVRDCVDDLQLSELLFSSSIFILPSRREGFGLAALEALAHGVPCILTDLPALRENFGKSAIFVPRNDGGSLARETLNLLDDQERQRRMATEGVKLARCLGWAAVAAKEALAINRVVQRILPVRPPSPDRISE